MCSLGGRGEPGLKTACRAAGAALGFLVLSTALPAQTLPIPTLPRQPPATAPESPDQVPAGGPDAPDTPGPERPHPWEYGLGIGVGWDSNIDFRVPDGPSSWAISPRGNAARLFRGPKGLLRLGGSADWVGYPDQEGLNRYNVDVGFDGTYRSSLNTTWRANGTWDSGYSDSSSVLSDQGVLLPLVKTRTLAGGLGVTRSLGQRASFRLDGRFYRAEFDEDGEALGLVDSQSMRGTAGLEQRLGQRDTAAVEYSLESARGRVVPGVDDEGESYYLTHFGSLQWTHILTPRSGLLLEAGGSYTPEAELAGLERQANFYGGASYNRQVKSSTIVLFVRREVVPAFGLGVSRLETRVGLNATIPMGRAWRLRLSGLHVMPETPEGLELTYPPPDEAFASMGWRVSRRFEVSAETRYRRRGSTVTTPAIEGFQAGVFLSLLSPGGMSTTPSRGR